MASELATAQTPTRSILERLMISSRYGDLSLLLPFFLGPNGTDPSPTRPDPHQNSVNGPDPQSQSERIILVNPFTQSMVVVRGASLSSLFRGDPSKRGRPPASKAFIEALPVVEMEKNEMGECVICLEEWKTGGGVAKETPCKHRFHGNCIERWLGIHGSCPVCRFEMPSDQENLAKKRAVWVSFSFSFSA